MKTRKLLTICVMMFFSVLSVQIAADSAEVVSVTGSVQARPVSAEEWTRVEKGMRLAAGDLVRTARNSVAEVALDADKKNTIRIEPKTLVTLGSATADTIDRLDLAKGKVYANLENIKSGLSFEINTPSAVAGVRGSAVSVYVERDSDEIVALKHTVYVKAYNVDKQLISEIMLPEGFKTMIERFGEPSIFYQISSREFEHFDNKMDDLSANLEGRMSARAKAREERLARQQAQERGLPDEQMPGPTVDQQEIIQQIVDTKEAIEDRKTQETIEELREVAHSEEEYHGPGCQPPHCYP